MPLLLFLVRPIDKGGKDLDQHVVATGAKGCCLCRYAQGCAFELVREDGAAGRDGGRHRLDTDIDAGAVERGKPARVHKHTLPIDIYGSNNPARVPESSHSGVDSVTAHFPCRVLQLSAELVNHYARCIPSKARHCRGPQRCSDKEPHRTGLGRPRAAEAECNTGGSSIELRHPLLPSCEGGIPSSERP